MHRSLRPFSLAAVALGLVVLAAVETLEGPPAPLPEVERIELHLTGEVLGPGVLVDDLVRTDPEPDGSLRLSGFDEDGPVGRLGLRNGDLVRCADGTPFTAFSSATGTCGRAGEAGTPMCLSVRREEAQLEVCYTFHDEPRRGAPPAPRTSEPDRARARLDLEERVRIRRQEREDRRRAGERAGPPDGER